MEVLICLVYSTMHITAFQTFTNFVCICNKYCTGGTNILSYRACVMAYSVGSMSKNRMVRTHVLPKVQRHAIRSICNSDFLRCKWLSVSISQCVLPLSQLELVPAPLLPLTGNAFRIMDG